MIKTIALTVFLISGFCLFWAMLGYKLFIKYLATSRFVNKPVKTKEKKTVTVMIVAHNEEKVIRQKLDNVVDNDYPSDKIKYLVASDNSTDSTNEIVRNYIIDHPEHSISLYITKEHKGKTNAQNEAQKTIDSEILIMTDANSMFERNAISELVSSFSDEDIVYVCGKLCFVKSDNLTTFSETTYWEGDLALRKVESDIQTITAGNGSIYACKNKQYIDIPPIECHDSSMPYIYSMLGKRAIYNEKAIAYEKTSEKTEDEFKRKVRMNRGIVQAILRGFTCMNVFKYKWFSIFYFGHRTTRYLLWLNHILVFISNIILAFWGSWFWKILLTLQIIFYVGAILGRRSKNKIIHLMYYYSMTVYAQIVGVFNNLTGKVKPTWKSVESTR